MNAARNGDQRALTWWEGNSTRMWRVLAAGWLSLLSFFIGWSFQQITTFPTTYATKNDVACLQQAIDRQIDRSNSNFVRVNDKLDEINLFLRNMPMMSHSGKLVP